ncbi:Cof-type HAD-IIB family hydrolase [Paenibacillus sp. GYB003]|uniref:Cof-type HAD-IIB family hydrolase n=1 Tax=Paenibacillus sp. GYB003 TaxID=2994392 RepID=UPI002F967E6C
MSTGSILFFDIDGTLLDHDKRLPPRTKEAIFALKERGHEVAIATGRAPFMFEKLREELRIDTYVSYNGQYVVLRGDVLYTNPLNPNALQALTDTAIGRGDPIVYMDHEDMQSNVPEHAYVVESIESLKIDRFPSLGPDYYKSRDIYQCLLFCEREEKYEAEFPAFDFIRWHPVSVDVLPAGGSKAKGIEQIVRNLGIPKDRQYAFGDGLNDIEMLKTVANSVAMGNAHPEALKAARYRTTAVDEDGIWHGLKQLGLLE